MNRAIQRVMLGAMRGPGVLLVCAALAAAAACGPPGDSCPNDAPQSCPSPAPSYAGEVQAIIQSRCVPCHAPGGQEAIKPLLTYMEAYNLRVMMLTQVASCRMPLAGAPQLSPDERQTLMGWIVCGAPNN
jgi:uncharacterized membrane protein